MKSLGTLLFIGALVALGIGFTYETTVATGMGGRVHNIGLISEKQNIFILGGALLVAGALLLVLSGRGQAPSSDVGSGYRKCSSCAELVKDEAKVCRYCQRDLPSSSELEAQTRADRERLIEARSLQGEAARQAEERLPQGVCPNCHETITLASAECKHCKAAFGPGSAWRVLPKSEF